MNTYDSALLSPPVRLGKLRIELLHQADAWGGGVGSPEPDEDGNLKNIDELRRENEVLRERICISTSFNLDTVLHGSVESARPLTGAG